MSFSQAFFYTKWTKRLSQITFKISETTFAKTYKKPHFSNYTSYVFFIAYNMQSSNIVNVKMHFNFFFNKYFDNPYFWFISKYYSTYFF